MSDPIDRMVNRIDHIVTHHKKFTDNELETSLENLHDDLAAVQRQRTQIISYVNSLRLNIDAFMKANKDDY